MKYILLFIFIFVNICIAQDSSIYDLTNNYDVNYNYKSTYGNSNNSNTNVDVNGDVFKSKMQLPEINCGNIFKNGTYEKLLDSFNSDSYATEYLNKIQDFLTSGEFKDFLMTKIVNGGIEAAAEAYAKKVCTEQIMGDKEYMDKLAKSLTDKDLIGAIYECNKMLTVSQGKRDFEGEVGKWRPYIKRRPWKHWGYDVFSGLMDVIMDSDAACADKIRKEIKLEGYEDCVTKQRAEFITQASKLAHQSHKFNADMQIQMREECLLDKSQNESDLHYLLYGNQSGTKTTSYQKDGFTNKKQDPNVSQQIRLPNGELLDISSKEFKAMKLDDFLPQTTKSDVFNKVLNVYNGTDKNGWKDFMLYNVSTYTINTDPNEYQKIFNLMKKYSESYLKDVVFGIFSNIENNEISEENENTTLQNILPTKDIVLNCVKVLSFIENKYNSLINNRYTHSDFVISNQKIQTNLDMLKMYNEQTYYFCTEYLKEYKDSLKNVITNINGFISADGSRTNNELLNLYNMSFEKLQQQVDFINENQNAINRKYHSIIDLYTKPVKYYSAAADETAAGGNI